MKVPIREIVIRARERRKIAFSSSAELCCASFANSVTVVRTFLSLDACMAAGREKLVAFFLLKSCGLAVADSLLSRANLARQDCQAVLLTSLLASAIGAQL